MTTRDAKDLLLILGVPGAVAAIAIVGFLWMAYAYGEELDGDCADVCAVRRSTMATRNSYGCFCADGSSIFRMPEGYPVHRPAR